MKVLLSIISLFLLPFLIHNALSKPAELLDLNFDTLTPAANDDGLENIEARTEEAEEGGGKQTSSALTLDDLFGSFSTSTLNDVLRTKGLSNLVSQQQTSKFFWGQRFIISQGKDNFPLVRYCY